MGYKLLPEPFYRAVAASVIHKNQLYLEVLFLQVLLKLRDSVFFVEDWDNHRYEFAFDRHIRVRLHRHRFLCVTYSLAPSASAGGFCLRDALEGALLCSAGTPTSLSL